MLVGIPSHINNSYDYTYNVTENGIWVKVFTFNHANSDICMFAYTYTCIHISPTHIYKHIHMYTSFFIFLLNKNKQKTLFKKDMRVILGCLKWITLPKSIHTYTYPKCMLFLCFRPTLNSLCFFFCFFVSHGFC